MLMTLSSCDVTPHTFSPHSSMSPVRTDESEESGPNAPDLALINEHFATIGQSVHIIKQEALKALTPAVSLHNKIDQLIKSNRATYVLSISAVKPAF